MYLVNKYFVVLIFFFGLTNLYGQQGVHGIVIDGENGARLSAVHIINAKDSSIVISNAQGKFTLRKTGQYKFTRIGYHEKLLKIDNLRYTVIQLRAKSLELNEVIVSTNQLPLQLKKSVATIHVLSAKELERGNNVDIAPVLNKLPGIYMHSGALNTNRITIRGIGSRNLFGTSKIRAYFEDIPLTSGSGETTIEDFELNSIARLEIIKGASSSIYGAGLGGTIHLLPKKPYVDITTIESEFTAGSFGLTKGILHVNQGNFKNSFRAVYSTTHSDSYRDNNEYDRQTFTLTSNHYLSEKDEVSFVGSYVDLKAFIPSSVDEETFINNPTSAPFTWARSKGFEDAQRGIFGVSWKHQYKSNVKLSTSVFTSFRNAYEARPFNILTEDTFASGIRSRLLGNTVVFKKKLDWTAGGELFRDRHVSETFENLYQDFPEGTGSVQGNSLSNFKEKRTYYNLFFETNYHLTNKTMFSMGFNFNKTSYTLNDRFITVDNPDQSGNYDFEGIFSPKFGVSHLISKNISLYTSISHGFSPPSISETLLPDGQINTSIKPETGWNFELGTRGSIIDNKLQFNIAVFRLDVRNLLVARRIGDDQFIGVNAGKTQHDGLELSMDYNWVETKAIAVNSYLSYTLNAFIFKEFVDDGQNFSGNDLTGVPSDIFNVGIDIHSNSGVYGSVSFQYIGAMPITDANSLFSDSYKLTNLKAGYKLSITKKLQLHSFLGFNNIFDEKYASQILINASSFGGRAPRYFYPGNPSNYYMGMHLKYLF